jgi:alkyldihydroxyacetonephosphate synthase
MPAMNYARENLKWNGWGWTDTSFPLEEAASFWTFLRDALGLDVLPETPSAPLDALDVPPSTLSNAARDVLAAQLDPDRVRTGRYERVLHATGRSYHDLLRLRTGRIEAFPDAVVYPETHDEVAAVLAVATQHNYAVVPFGGGSSVVGGVDAVAEDDQAGTITLDTTRMRALLHFEATSRLATFQAGVYGPLLEDALRSRGYTLGHFPQSFEFSTLGGWIAARSAGQFSDRYGKAEDFLAAARVATPRGTWSTHAVPASAAGPDLNQLIAGSEGGLGVITEATIRVRPHPDRERTFMVLFRTFDDGLHAARSLRHAEHLPLAMIRLSDADETRFLLQFRGNDTAPSALRRLFKRWLAARGYTDAPCLMLVALAGSGGHVAQGTARMLRIVRSAGGAFAGPYGDWRAGHYAMPYLRDDLMDRGIGVDTMETATRWSNVATLHRAVRSAVDAHAAERGVRIVVLAHTSHSYTDGACLYFTLLFPMHRARPVAQWRALKTTVSQTIVEHGGTISHHHGVGRDHRPWMDAEKGALGLDVLRAAKARLDPDGVLNPSKLIK